METAPFFNLMNPLIMWSIVALQVASVALLLGLVGVPFFSRLVELVGRRTFVLSFLVLLASLIGSLYYSEVAAFPACSLCWWQRVFIYPQIALFGLALWYKRRDVLLYTSTLSAVGLGFALYNVYIQSFGAASVFCEPGSVLSSCLEKYVEGFGYITIPVMSVTMLAFLLLVAWAGVKSGHFSLTK
ncbi:MAG: hypothetical protein AMXMBFR44_0490 [Candidatus Campbellbacteria bacterium]